MGALVPPELQWVGNVDSGFFFFFFFWAWDSPEGGVGDQQCGGLRQWGAGEGYAAETMDLQQRARLYGYIWEKCCGRSTPYFGYK